MGILSFLLRLNINSALRLYRMLLAVFESYVINRVALYISGKL